MIRRLLLRAVRIAALTMLGLSILLLGCQSHFMYFPRPYGAAELSEFRQSGGREIAFQTSQGRQVAYYIPPEKSGTDLPERLWIGCAGNGTVALDWSLMVKTFDPRFGWLLLDYPGYGQCEGQPNPGNVRENAVAAFDALARDLHTSPDDLRPRLGVMGHSLGCAAGLIAAEALGVKRVLLISPFTSMTDMGRLQFGWPLCYLNRHRYDNRARLDSLAACGARVYIFHGGNDEVIPVVMGRELAARHPEIVTYHEIPGETHMGVIVQATKEIGDALRVLAFDAR